MHLVLSLTAFLLASSVALASLEARGPGNCADPTGTAMSCYNSCTFSMVMATPVLTSCDLDWPEGTTPAPMPAPTCFCEGHAGLLGCLNKCCDNEGSNDLAYTESSILAEYCSGSPVAAMPTAAATTAAAGDELGTPVETTSGGSVATATATKKKNSGTNMAPASLVLGGLLSSGLLFVGMWL